MLSELTECLWCFLIEGNVWEFIKSQNGFGLEASFMIIQFQPPGRAREEICAVQRRVFLTSPEKIGQQNSWVSLLVTGALSFPAGVGLRLSRGVTVDVFLSCVIR